jgi:putative FmdB family regulatory protein
MPIYEYQCDSCGSQRELFVRSADVAAPMCAVCRKRMRRVISPTSFILKGSGWYVTDYPSDARKKGLEREKAPAPVAEAAGGKKEEPPTAKKTEAALPASGGGEKKAAKPSKKRR